MSKVGKYILSGLLLLFAGVLPLGAQSRMSVSANAADCADCGTLNVEMGLAVLRQWSVTAGAKYNPFEFGDATRRKRRTFDAGVRFWPWHCYSGWWVAAKARYEEFNNASGMEESSKEGDRMGASLSAGYSIMLGRRFNLDLGLGVWGGMETFTSYSCPTCGEIMQRGSRTFILPSDITVALAFVF